MSDHFNLLQDSLVKDKVPKEIVNAVKDSGQWLCQSSQKQLSEGGFAFPVTEKGRGKGRGSILTSLLQLVVSSPKTPETGVQF